MKKIKRINRRLRFLFHLIEYLKDHLSLCLFSLKIVYESSHGGSIQRFRGLDVVKDNCN